MNDLCFHGVANCTMLFCKDQRAAKNAPKYDPPTIEEFYSYIPSKRLVRGTSEPEKIAVIVANYLRYLSPGDSPKLYDRFSSWKSNGVEKYFLMVNGKIMEQNER